MLLSLWVTGMEPLTVIVGIVLGMAVAAMLAVALMRLWPAGRAADAAKIADMESQLVRTRDEKAGVELRLAVECEKSSRAAALDSELRERTRETADQAALIAEKAAVLEEKDKELGRLIVRLEQADAALVTARRDVSDLRALNAAGKEALEQERRAAEEKLRLLTEARDGMTKEFKLLADGMMQTHGETFSKQNKEQIDAILSPLREKLAEFQQGITAMKDETTKERAGLAEHIRLLTESSTRMSLETDNLARALRGEAQTQGAWGEMILASILERSGLRSGEEYIVQQSFAGDDGQRLRPDVLVNLPGNQTIVIDSKVSLVAFDAHVNAANDDESQAALNRHLVSMRTHIRTLSGKDYHAAAGSHVDYVIMFVPIEGALAAALRADPSLTSYAVECNVAIATPTTLMIALRTVNNVWQVERRNRNADAIAGRAGLLYEKLVGFVGDMSTLETSLDRANRSFRGAMNKLSTGSGNLIRQAEQLKELGARTTKSLPPALTGDDKEAAATEAEAEDARV